MQLWFDVNCVYDCREVLLEYYNSIGEEGGPEEAARARSHVRGLLEALGAQLEEEKKPQAVVGEKGIRRPQPQLQQRVVGRRDSQPEEAEVDAEETAMELQQEPPGCGRGVAPLPAPAPPPPLPVGLSRLVWQKDTKCTCEEVVGSRLYNP